MGGKSNRSGELDELGRFRAITPELSELAERIRSIFIDARSAYVPGAAGVSRSQDGTFIKAARRCLERGLGAQQFVLDRIGAVVLRGGRIYPTILISDTVDDRVAEYRDRVVDRSQIGYIWQMNMFTARLKFFSPEAAVRDPMNDFSPLFRCYLARVHGVSGVLDLYREGAVQELATNPVARELFLTGDSQ